ncbi:hypothetical protein [Reinekea sp. G2M2-21]|uniref:hypothetical protein n=1 Tax=Reinekea sp. G2M2-21 TaxID=2788942 RepID=UPI0018AC80FF|nr:hypothetical protein [Reinekea sp. G2M2-21]
MKNSIVMCVSALVLMACQPEGVTAPQLSEPGYEAFYVGYNGFYSTVPAAANEPVLAERGLLLLSPTNPVERSNSSIPFISVNVADLDFKSDLLRIDVVTNEEIPASLYTERFIIRDQPIEYMNRIGNGVFDFFYENEYGRQEHAGWYFASGAPLQSIQYNIHNFESDTMVPEDDVFLEQLKIQRFSMNESEVATSKIIEGLNSGEKCNIDLSTSEVNLIPSRDDYGMLVLSGDVSTDAFTGNVVLKQSSDELNGDLLSGSLVISTGKYAGSFPFSLSFANENKFSAHLDLNGCDMFLSTEWQSLPDIYDETRWETVADIDFRNTSPSELYKAGIRYKGLTYGTAPVLKNEPTINEINLLPNGLENNEVSDLKLIAFSNWQSTDAQFLSYIDREVRLSFKSEVQNWNDAICNRLGLKLSLETQANRDLVEILTVNIPDIRNIGVFLSEPTKLPPKLDLFRSKIEVIGEGCTDVFASKDLRIFLSNYTLRFYE